MQLLVEGEMKHIVYVLAIFACLLSSGAEADTFDFWIKAYIAGDVAGAVTVKNAVGTYIKHPLGLDYCYRTDNRSTDSRVGVRARMTSRMKLQLAFGATPVVLLNPPDQQWTGPTVERQCSDGKLTCAKFASDSGMYFDPPVTISQSEFWVPLYAKASDPCVFTAAFFGDLDYNGTLKIDLQARTVTFTGFVDKFPSFEAYVSVNGGAPMTLFTQEPAPGATVFSLIGFADVPVTGTVPY